MEHCNPKVRRAWTSRLRRGGVGYLIEKGVNYSMLQEATLKIQNEMIQNTQNVYIQSVGGFLLQHLEANPESAEKILAQDKTIGKSLDAMRKEAEKKKVGNCAVLTDQEGFVVVLKYFGIESGQGPAAAPVIKHTPRPFAPEKPAVDFDVKLEDLL